MADESDNNDSATEEGHHCPALCQQLGFANCRCQKDDNTKKLLIAIEAMIQELTPVHWQLFSKKPAWVNHPSRPEYLLNPELNEDDLIAEAEPADMVLLDNDLQPEFEPTANPLMVILRTMVPFSELKPQFETYLKQLAVTLPDVNSMQDLVDRGYQLMHEPEQGITLLRMPRPEHQVQFLQQLARQGMLTTTAQQIPTLFAQMMDWRYRQLQPNAMGGMRRRTHVDDDMDKRNGQFRPSPFYTKPLGSIS